MTSPLRQPKNLYSLDVHLRIDDAIDGLFRADRKSVRIHKRIPTQAAGVAFGRRALEVAILSALNAKEKLEAGQHADDFREGAEVFSKAATAIRDALKYMARDPSVGEKSKDWKPRKPYPDCGTQPLVGILRQYYRHVTTQENDRQKVRQTDLSEASGYAEQAAWFLSTTDEIMHGLAGFCRQMEAEIRHDRANPGAPEKMAFISILVEAWLFLTGRRPGRQPDRNPFLDFALLAWEDAAGGSEESFHHQLKIALDALPEDINANADDFPEPWWR